MTVLTVRAGSGRRAGLRPLLLGGLLAIAVTIGLLTMCTLNATAGSHEPSPAGATAVHHGADDVGGQHTASPVVVDGHHPGHAMAMACVMALLAFIIVLALPRGSGRRATARFVADPLPHQRAIARRTPPSPLVLCISRT
ncbi:hypothetical protein GCM10028820_05860 [Tessaracoccus terricola]